MSYNSHRLANPSRPGTIVILNGPTSAGKSSAATAFQEVAREPYLQVGIDLFLFQVWPEHVWGEPHGFHFCDIPSDGAAERMWTSGPVADDALSGMHSAIAALSMAGQNVVCDHVIGHPRWLHNLVQHLQHLPVYFVGFHCPSTEILRRAVQRGNRPTGAQGKALARWWERTTRYPGIYDLEIDTSKHSPHECAMKVQRFLDSPMPPTAIRSLANHPEFARWSMEMEKA